jgi:class 3 adenylate cyclase
VRLPAIQHESGGSPAPTASPTPARPRRRGSDLPGGTVTFLFTDIEGSTRLAARLSERYVDVLADHQRLLREAFAGSSGREMDTQGDAFFVVFPRAKDAVAAALSGQRALAGHRWPDDGNVRVRMGLHTGEPAAAHGRYIGLGVHRAARICSAGHGGQILLSSATYALLAETSFPTSRSRISASTGSKTSSDRSTSTSSPCPTCLASSRRRDR